MKIVSGFAIFAAAALLLPVSVASAAPVRATSQPEVASTGSAVPISKSTRIEYLPAIRVWYDQAGQLLVCRHPGDTYTFSSRYCELPGSKDVKSGWVYLEQLQTPGYTLTHVQVNQSTVGPALVLYWSAVKP